MKKYNLISGLLDRHRELTLAEKYIEYENGDLKGREFTKFYKEDIVDFKHRTEWIVWYKFIVGRQYVITFKNKKDQELKIQFVNYFGLHREYTQLYAEIVKDIWYYYHGDIVDSYLEKIYRNEQLEIQGLKISCKGIQFPQQNALLLWQRVEMREYKQYFAVYDKAEPERHVRIGYNDYGAETLWSLIKTIAQTKPTHK